MSGLEIAGLVLGIIGFAGQMKRLFRKKRPGTAIVAQSTSTTRRTDGSSTVVIHETVQKEYGESLRLFGGALDRFDGAVNQFNHSSVQQLRANQAAPVLLVEQSRRFTQTVIFMAAITACLMYLLGYYKAERDMLMRIAPMVHRVDIEDPLPPLSSSPFLNGLFDFMIGVVRGALFVPVAIYTTGAWILARLWASFCFVFKLPFTLFWASKFGEQAPTKTVSQYRLSKPFQAKETIRAKTIAPRNVKATPSPVHDATGGIAQLTASIIYKCMISSAFVGLWPFNSIYELLVALLTVVGVPISLTYWCCCLLGAIPPSIVVLVSTRDRVCRRNCGTDVHQEASLVGVLFLSLTLLSRSLLDLSVSPAAVWSSIGVMVALRCSFRVRQIIPHLHRVELNLESEMDAI